MLRYFCFFSLFMVFSTVRAAEPQPEYHSGYIAYEPDTPYRHQANDILSKFGHLSAQELIDTASNYEKHGVIDTALICYNLIINTPVRESGPGQQHLKIKALNNSAILYFWMCDYLKSYELLIKGLELCEEYPNDSTEFKIYANMGNIYCRFKEFDLGKIYFLKSLELCRDSAGIAVIFNNIGEAEKEKGELDSAYYYVNKSLQISKRLKNDVNLSAMFSTTASMYQKKELYDSALYYYRLALDEARMWHRREFEAGNLSNLGKLFFGIGDIDSAISHIEMSNDIAKENNYFNTILDNYLTLSSIEESRGRPAAALEEMKKYSSLKDAMFGVGKLVDINQMQRLYEVSKTNRQIEELAVEQRIKERIISYQRTGLFIAIAVLLLLAAILLFVFSQKRKLDKAYKALFEKNLEIISLQERSSEKQTKSTHHDDRDEELLDKILTAMEDTAVICDPKFSINMLSSLVQANHTYVSQVINNMLHKNFRAFLNGYRIREAQRLFSEPDAAKYTIESVSLLVGYKSRSTFRTAFQEVTGVSPSYYLKSMAETAKR